MLYLARRLGFWPGGPSKQFSRYNIIQRSAFRVIQNTVVHMPIEHHHHIHGKVRNYAKGLYDIGIADMEPESPVPFQSAMNEDYRGAQSCDAILHRHRPRYATMSSHMLHTIH